MGEVSQRDIPADLSLQGAYDNCAAVIAGSKAVAVWRTQNLRPILKLC
jgi:hypothetical protein